MQNDNKDGLYQENTCNSMGKPANSFPKLTGWYLRPDFLLAVKIQRQAGGLSTVGKQSRSGGQKRCPERSVPGMAVY